MQILPNGKTQFIDQNGAPLVNGSVYFYAPGTTNPLPTYQDSAGSIPNTNPIQLDSRGQAIIWGNTTYRQAVYDASNVLVWDQVVSAAASSAALAGTGGASQIGMADGSTLASAFSLSLNRVVDSISALRATPHAFYQRAFVTGYYAPHDGGGGAYQYDPNDTSSADNGGTIIVANDGGRWKLQVAGRLSLKQFGAKGDGTTNDSPAVIAWMTLLLTSGGSGWVPEGTYSLASSIAITLSASVDIQCSSDALFVAASGFPAGYKLFQILTGVPQVNVFKWIGGQFDGTNIPNSTAGQANDIFGLNATNVNHVRIELDRTTAGADWLHSGADSHLFIGGGSESIVAHISDCVGAWDVGIYISRDINGTLGGSLRATGNFSKCNVGINVKRQFERAYINANVVDCLNGVGTGVANTTNLPLADGGNNYTIIVNAERTENSAFLNATQGVNVMVTATNIGVSIGTYTSTQAAALRLEGASGVGGTVVATGVNTACTSNSNFNAVRTEQVVITAGTIQSTDNMLNVVSMNLGRSVRENNSSDRNTFNIKDFGSATGPTLLGANSIYTLSDGTSAGLTVNGAVTPIFRTFATLPTSPKPGVTCCISDSPVNTFRALITAGGGAYQVNARYLSGQWTVD